MSDSDVARPTRATPRAGLSHRIRRVLLSDWGARILAIILFLLGWQILSMIVPRVPGPWEVFVFIFVEITEGRHGGVVPGQFWKHFFVTLQRFAIGLAMAVIGGAFLGVMIGSLPLARALLNDTLLVFLTLPAVIWAFLTVMWFGIGPKAPIVTTALSAAPFIAVNVAQGVRAIGPDLHRMSAAFGVPFTRRVRHLVLPAVMGYVFAGIRFAVIIGWNGVLLAEWFGAAEGVGWRARIWYDSNRYRGFVGWIVVFVVFILIVDRLVLTPLQRRAFRWRDAQVDLTKEMDLGATVTIAEWETADG
jgi:ABC-type nitrate/sulfonate/bicarbonate transport system permease component